MSGTVKKNLRELNVSIKKNLKKIESSVSSSGTNPGRATVVSAAKYYSALNRLAKE
jgi:hypothetical protein